MRVGDEVDESLGDEGRGRDVEVEAEGGGEKRGVLAWSGTAGGSSKDRRLGLFLGPVTAGTWGHRQGTYWRWRYAGG